MGFSDTLAGILYKGGDTLSGRSQPKAISKKRVEELQQLADRCKEKPSYELAARLDLLVFAILSELETNWDVAADRVFCPSNPKSHEYGDGHNQKLVAQRDAHAAKLVAAFTAAAEATQAYVDTIDSKESPKTHAHAKNYANNTQWRLDVLKTMADFNTDRNARRQAIQAIYASILGPTEGRAVSA